MFQTKNPERFKYFLLYLPKKYYLGTTIETNREDLIKQYSKAPSIESRVSSMIYLEKYPRYVTLEPIFDFDLEIFVAILKRINPNKIYIGADSKVYKYPKIYNNLKLEEPSKQKTLELIHELNQFTTVEIKSNLKRIIGEEYLETC